MFESELEMLEGRNVLIKICTGHLSAEVVGTLAVHGEELSVIGHLSVVNFMVDVIDSISINRDLPSIVLDI